MKVICLITVGEDCSRLGGDEDDGAPASDGLGYLGCSVGRCREVDPCDDGALKSRSPSALDSLSPGSSGPSLRVLRRPRGQKCGWYPH